MSEGNRPIPLRAIIASSLIAAGACAQRFSDLPMQHVPLENVRGSCVAAGDIDGDLDVDLVFPRESEVPLVYRNLGDGMFVIDGTGMPTSLSGEIRATALLDVDGDGDLDLLYTRWIARPVLWRNDQGTFVDVTATQMPNVTSPSDPSGILGGDVDNDGDLDLLLTGGNTLLLRNNGNGVFTNATAQLPAGFVPVGESALVDMDGDGDLDMVGARRYWQGLGRHLFWVNNGLGTFTDQSALRLPASTHQYGGGDTVAVGDVDGDGDLDLVAPQFADNVSVFRNPGNAVFTTLEPVQLVGVMQCPYQCAALHLRLADFDRDGDLDLFCESGGGYGHHLFVNDGTGTFTPAAADALPQCRQVLYGQIVADVDSDGDLDIVQATPHQNFQAWPVLAHPVLFNDGHGRFVDPGSDAIAHTVDEVQCAAAIDIDHDGLLDVIRGAVFSSLGTGWGILWAERNDGSGHFVESGRIAYDTTLGVPRTLAVGDVDGDGWSDFYCSTDTANNLLFRNQGNGTFALHGTLPVTPTRSSAAEFVDVDGDGDLDLITARLYDETWSGGAGRTSLWRNDGNGFFVDTTATDMPALDDRCPAIAVFDLGNDGDPDVFVPTNWSPQGTAARLFVNNGDGTFTNEPARLPAGVHDDVEAAVAADFDRDGYVDLLVREGASLRLWRGNASGTFTDVSASWNSWFHDGVDLRVADFDLDGWVDVYPTWDQPEVLRNTGTTLQSVQPITTTVYPGNVWPRLPMVADFDGDGDVDIVYGISGYASAQWNLDRQVALPRFAKPGATMPIRVYRRPGSAPSSCLAAVATCFGREHLQSPLGTLWIDPTGPLDVQLAVLSSPGGVADVGLPIPPWQFLQGLELTVQALLFDPVSGLVLTNGVTTTVR